MSAIFIQTIGGSKGSKVKIIKETGGFYLVRNISNGLKYLIAKYNLDKYYEEVKRKPKKIKREPRRK